MNSSLDREIILRNILRDRDPSFYENIKDVIEEMPDLRPFKQEQSRSSLSSWNNVKRLEWLLLDMENLDRAEIRGDISDLDYIHYLNKDEEFMKLSLAIKRKRITNSVILSFFLRYPALSWILMRIDENARLDAVKSGYIDYINTFPLSISERIKLLPYLLDQGLSDWVYEIPLSKEEKISLAPHTQSLPTIKFLLNSLTHKELKEGIYEYDRCVTVYYIDDLFSKGSFKKNIPLLRYLLNRGLTSDSAFIAVTGDISLMKQSEEISPIVVDRRTIENAIRSGNPEMLELVINISLKNDPDFPPYSDVSDSSIKDVDDLDMINAIINTGGPIPKILLYAILLPSRIHILEYLLEEKNIEFPNPKEFSISIYQIETLKYLITMISPEETLFWEEALREWITGNNYIHYVGYRGSASNESLSILVEAHSYSPKEIKNVTKGSGYKNRIDIVRRYIYAK